MQLAGPPDSAAGLASMKDWARRCRKILLRHGLSSLGVRNVRLVGAFAAWKSQVRRDGRGLAALRRWARSLPALQLRFAFEQWRHSERRFRVEEGISRLQSSVRRVALRVAYSQLAAASPLDRPARHYRRTLLRRSVRAWTAFVRRDKEVHAEVWWALAVRHDRSAICRRALERLQYATVLQQEQRRVLAATERVCMRSHSRHMLARWWQAVERYRRGEARRKWLARVHGYRGSIWQCFSSWHAASGGGDGAAARRAMDHLRRQRLARAWNTLARNRAGRRALRAVVGRAVAVGQGLTGASTRAARWPAGLARLVGLGPALVLTTRSAFLRWRTAPAADAGGGAGGGTGTAGVEPAPAPTAEAWPEAHLLETAEGDVADAAAPVAAAGRLGASLSQSQFLEQVERARAEAEEAEEAFCLGAGTGGGGGGGDEAAAAQARRTADSSRSVAVRGLSRTVRRGTRRSIGGRAPRSGQRKGQRSGTSGVKRVGNTVREALGDLLAEAHQRVEVAAAAAAAAKAMEAEEAEEAAATRGRSQASPRCGAAGRSHEAVYARVRARVARGGAEADRVTSSSVGASRTRESLPRSGRSHSSSVSGASESSTRRRAEAWARKALGELLADVDLNRRHRIEPGKPCPDTLSTASSLDEWRRAVERRRVLEGSLDSARARKVWGS